LYFMLGLPTETMDDIEGIINLVAKIRAAGGQGKGKRLQARVSLATFIPKPHTPFQWVAQENEDQLVARHERLQQGLHRLGTRLAWSDPKVSQLEAALSRGDRRIGRVIHRAWQLGATFDAWGECFNHTHWLRAFTECGLDPAFYNRQRPLDERLPWDHIDAGVTPAFLKAEYRRSLEGQSTPDCRYQECSSCGLQRWQASCRQRAVEITDSRR
ncbi:MAG: B12-binding domain-containing radical SAM protein, partial [Chloroflexota bacterium]